MKSSATYSFGMVMVATMAHFSLSCVTTPVDPEANVSGECSGVNSCKGKGECGNSSGASCAGTNACKGQGWITLTKSECAAQKGVWRKG